VTFDTRVQLNTACSALVAFRMTEIGDLVSHPISCTGDILTLTGTGGSFPSTYFFAQTSPSQTSTTGTNQVPSSQVGALTNQPANVANQANTNQVTSAMAN